MKIYEGDTQIKVPANTILRFIVLKETTRQHWSEAV